MKDYDHWFGVPRREIAIALAIAAFPHSSVVLAVIACFMVQMPMASVFFRIVPRILKKGNVS